MHRVKKAACILLLVTPALGAAPLQKVTDKTDRDQTKSAGQRGPAPPDTATRQQALAQLDLLLKQSKSFEDTEVRVRLTAQIADLLWERDEPRARSLFEAAFKEIASTPLPPQDKSMPPSYVGADSHYPIRNDVIRLASQRDPSLGAALVDSVVDQPPNVDPKFQGSGYGKYSERDMLQFQFGLYITRSDPERAAAIARNFVRKLDLGRAMPMIQSLRGKDAMLADDLFAQALSQVRQSGATSTENIRNLADYLFSNFGEGVIRFTTGSRTQGESEGNKVSPALTAQFMDLAYGAIMQWTSAASKDSNGPNSPANDSDRSDFTVAKLLLPFFDQHMPDKAEAIRTRMNEAHDDAGRRGQSQPDLTRPETVEEVFSRADKAPNASEKDRIYSEAIFQAIRSHHPDAARTILERISDERMRSQLDLMVQRATEQERSQKAHAALESRDFDSAYELIKGLSDLRLQINMLSNMAGSLFFKKENARALKILDEAERLAANEPNGIDRASEMLQLAGLAARLDIDRGFSEMKPAVEAINNAGLAPQWQKLETTNDPKTGITTRKNIGLAMFGGLLFFDNGFSLLARADFDRALMLAKAIELKEASALAQLSVCRGVLVSQARSR